MYAIRSYYAAAGGDGGDGDGEPLLLQLLHQHSEAVPLGAEHVLHRHPAVFEGQLAGILAAQPELVELATTHEAGSISLDQDEARITSYNVCYTKLLR